MENDRMVLQLNHVRVDGLSLFFLFFGKEVIIMELFLGIFIEVILREISAYFLRKNILDNKKTTPRRRKQKG
jgi:hypothetical protein